MKSGRVCCERTSAEILRNKVPRGAVEDPNEPSDEDSDEESVGATLVQPDVTGERYGIARQSTKLASELFKRTHRSPLVPRERLADSKRATRSQCGPRLDLRISSHVGLVGLK